MKCYECRVQTETRIGNYSYKESGLPNITLCNVKISRCPSCGEEGVTIPRMEDLHRTIARIICRKSERLTPEEIRFLRTSLGWSGVDFARQFGVESETVSRWENGHQKMGASYDKLLRFCVESLAPVDSYLVENLQKIGVLEPKSIRFCMEMINNQWSSREMDPADLPS